MLGLLAVSVILSTPDAKPPHVAPAAAQSIAIDLSAHPDTVLANPPLAVRRERGTLHIGDTRLIDTGDCEADECDRYRLDAVWPGGLIGVRFSGYESMDYWLVGKNGATAIAARPIASPSGRYLFVGFRDDLNDQSNSGIPDSIAIWRTSDVQRVRVIDAPILLYAYPEFAAWHGDDCIEFAANPASADDRITKHYWLVREAIDWTLHENRPATCPSN